MKDDLIITDPAQLDWVIQGSKRILALVDVYVDSPTDFNRGLLRKALMEVLNSKSPEQKRLGKKILELQHGLERARQEIAFLRRHKSNRKGQYETKTLRARTSSQEAHGGVQAAEQAAGGNETEVPEGS